MIVDIEYSISDFRFNEIDFIRSISTEIELGERVTFGKVLLIFCNNQFIQDLNKRCLGHDYPTDCITFGNRSKQGIVGEIYVGVEIVRLNSELYCIPFVEELKRVLTHCLLHLCGYNDNEADARSRMTELENFYLSNFI